MMRAAIKSIGSPDVDLATFRPDDPNDLEVLIELAVGPEGGQGADIFGVVVVTPARLAAMAAELGPIVGRHYLIVDDWHWPVIEQFLMKLVERETGDTWQQLGERIARIGHWEFEDYREFGE
jgi:hypothetical protein